MGNRLWSVALGALVLSGLAMVGGTAVGGPIGPLAAGYGLLVALAALYLVGGLAVRDRVAARRAKETTERPTADRLAGRRVF